MSNQTDKPETSLVDLALSILVNLTFFTIHTYVSLNILKYIGLLDITIK